MLLVYSTILLIVYIVFWNSITRMNLLSISRSYTKYQLITFSPQIIQPGSDGLTLVLKDRSECTVKANIKDLTGIRQFFDHFRSDLDQKSLQVHIGALFEYILRKFPLFEDYVIHEEQIPDNTFLLDLCITSTGEDQSYEILNSKLNPHFMIDFCWHLMNSNEDILKEI